VKNKQTNNVLIYIEQWLSKSSSARRKIYGQCLILHNNGLAHFVTYFGRINEANQHRAQLVLRWVTIYKQVNYLGM